MIPKLGVVVHTYNPSTQGAEAGGLLQGQSELHSKTLSLKKTIDVKYIIVVQIASICIMFTIVCTYIGDPFPWVKYI